MCLPWRVRCKDRNTEKIHPPEANQVTAVLLVPITVAVNCWAVPVCNAIEPGTIETETVGDPLVTVTVAVPDCVVSAALVAMMTYVPAGNRRPCRGSMQYLCRQTRTKSQPYRCFR